MACSRLMPIGAAFDETFLALLIARKKVGDYRKLEVWRRSQAFTIQMRAMVAALPRSERRRIGDQIVRAADSIRLNIVEGAGLNSDPQFARCLGLSLGSANEVQDELSILLETDTLPGKFSDMPSELTEIRSMLAVLQARVAEDARKRKNTRKRKNPRKPRNKRKGEP